MSKVSKIAKTVTFSDGSIWEIKESLRVGVIAYNPTEHRYRHVIVDDAGCVIPAEPGSAQEQMHHMIVDMWDTQDRFTDVLDEVSTILDGDTNWPYMQYIVLAVRNEHEDKEKAETELAEWKRVGEEIIQAFGMRLVDGKVTYSNNPDFRWDAFDVLVRLMNSRK